MAFKGSVILVVNIIFGLCIDNLLTLNVMRPERSTIPRRIPIRPLDRSTMHRLSLRPTELNPDSESVFFPHQIPYTNHRPLQIMERISVPVDPNSNWPRKTKDNFNVLNFDAYVMKPNGLPINPVTERVFRLMNQTDQQQQHRHHHHHHRGDYNNNNNHHHHHRGDTKPSPSQHKFRSKSALKKAKKPVYGVPKKEYDELEFYRNYLEGHQKHAAMVKRLKSRPDPNARLPIGIDFFEQKQKNQMAFPPITYAPLYLNNIQRSHQQEEGEATNIQHVKMRHPNIIHHPIDHEFEIGNGLATTPIPTTLPLVIEEDAPAHTQVIPISEAQMMQDSDTYHSLASEPEMYKFTIDDVVFKPQPAVMVNYPYNGPVTLPPPSLNYQSAPNSHFMRPEDDIVNIPVSANTIHENRFDVNYPPQINDNQPPPSQLQIQANRINVRRPERRPIKTVSIEGAMSQQQIQKYSIDPIVITTQMAVTNDKDATSETTVPAKSTYETDSKRANEKRNRKHRRPHSERHRNDARKLHQQQQQQQQQRPDQTNNLEFSSSYTKRRTQGYNSEEDEPATTPISSVKSDGHKDENDFDETVTSSTVPKSEQVKHFQDTLTEQRSPHQIDYGHLKEDPAGWEERYERKNLKSQRHQGRVKWGDRKGNFGEHYYDLNHHRSPKLANHTRSSR